MRKYWCFILINLLIMQVCGQTLKVAIGFPEDNRVYNLVDKWLAETGELAGIKFQLQYMPFARAEKELVNGTIDGDVGRTRFVYEGDDRVVYTGYPILSTNYIVYTVRDDINPTDLIQLREMKLIINLGNRAAAWWTKENKMSDVIYSKDIISSFRMLLEGRADCYISSAAYIKMIIDNPDLASIRYLDPPVLMLPLYLALNIKHKNLEPGISSAIKEMNDSGRTEAIMGPLN